MNESSHALIRLLWNQVSNPCFGLETTLDAMRIAKGVTHTFAYSFYLLNSTRGYRYPSGECKSNLAFGYQSWSSNHLHHANIRDNCNWQQHDSAHHKRRRVFDLLMTCYFSRPKPCSLPTVFYHFLANQSFTVLMFTRQQEEEQGTRSKQPTNQYRTLAKGILHCLRQMWQEGWSWQQLG